MDIDKVGLQNFRSYQKEEFTLGGVSVVVGENGVGKSNLLEALYLLAVGKSFRAEMEYEMIKYGESFSRVRGEGQGERLEIMLTDGTGEGARKKYFVNGVAKRMVDFVGIFKAVLFGPGDIELITGGPSGRRKYLDFVISQKDREYRRTLISYEKGLRQRNKLLDLIREGTASRQQLFFWDKLLIKNGEYITRKREEYLERLNKGQGKYLAEYDKSVISENRLKQYETEELAAAFTLVGPHRDDFLVKQEGKDVSKYGSRGEQRMAMLWLKLGERDYLAEEGKMPALLLDDVFSELDHRHRDEVGELVERQVNEGGQVVMTTADEHLVPRVKEAKIIKL